MALKVFKPYSPGTRNRIDLVKEELTTDKPEKKLVSGLKSNAGRNSQGRITVRHQGGGHKRRYRMIDFKRNKHGIPGTVKTIEYDPNRSANIALGGTMQSASCAPRKSQTSRAVRIIDCGITLIAWQALSHRKI